MDMTIRCGLSMRRIVALMFDSKGLLYRKIPYIVSGAVKATQAKLQNRSKSRRATSAITSKIRTRTRASKIVERQRNIW